MNRSSSSSSIRSMGIAALLSLLLAGVTIGQERVNAASEAPSATPSPVKPQLTTESAQQPSADLVIGDGDLLQIRLYDVPEFNHFVRVDSNGEVSLPMIGAVKVLGLTPTQAEQVIDKAIKDKGYYNNPQISVAQHEFGGSRVVSVLGEVEHPGVFPVMAPRKLFDMLSAAGGTTPKAGREILISHRGGPDKVQKLTFSSDTDKQMDINVDVYPGDTVMVTKAPIVYVVGDVHLPGGFILDKSNGLTILQALALAQGATNTSALSNGKLIHKTADGPHETQVNLKKILSGKAEDLKLEADDILFIPRSTAKATMQGMSAALQTAAGAAVYRF
jgi:polysaccharide export outer membrane protein